MARKLFLVWLRHYNLPRRGMLAEQSSAHVGGSFTSSNMAARNLGGRLYAEAEEPVVPLFREPLADAREGVGNSNVPCLRHLLPLGYRSAPHHQYPSNRGGASYAIPWRGGGGYSSSTSQWPPFAGPLLASMPFSFSFLILFSTAVVLISSCLGVRLVATLDLQKAVPVSSLRFHPTFHPTFHPIWSVNNLRGNLRGNMGGNIGYQ